MSDMVIKGMEMLPEGYAYEVIIRGNGDVLDAKTGMKMGTAIELPPHGKLVSLADVMDILERSIEDDADLEYIKENLKYIHTIEG